MGLFLPTGSPNLGQKFHQEAMGAWWSQGQDGVQGHWKTQDLSMTMFSHSRHRPCISAPELGQQQVWQRGSWGTQNQGFTGAREEDRFRCETVPDWLLGFKWFMLQSLLH